jgi:hypothetical protein
MSLVLQSSGGGQITIQEPTTASNFTQTLPAVSGTVITTGNIPTGSVVQVVSTTKTDAFTTASDSYVDVTGFSASITPTSSTSRILIIVNSYVGINNINAKMNLVRGSTAIAQPTVGANPSSAVFRAGIQMAGSFNISFLDSPATTSSTTYKIQVKSSGGNTTCINRADDDANNSGVSTITLLEIAA